jgi:hypothetical protein
MARRAQANLNADGTPKASKEGIGDRQEGIGFSPET